MTRVGPVNEAELAALVPTLDRTAFAVLVRSVLGLRDAGARSAISTADRLRAGLWEFMAAVGFVSDAQAREVLKLVGPGVEALAGELDAATTLVRLTRFEVTFADKRWAHWPGRDAWYDVTFDEHVEALPGPPVLRVSCDVTALHVRHAAWLAKRRKEAGNGGRSQPTGDAG